ncbi:MFS transporter [Nocardia sp. NPDC051570]|uniref:MFS transporter n=1 Tax=Nocardia sp. NPDC051570 TaxID=3364324 RepID=UPI0037A19FA9
MATITTAPGTQDSLVGDSGAAHDSSVRRWWVLAVLGTAQLTITLTATVMNIALPYAQRDLGFSDASRQWVVIGYTLAFGSLLLLGGRLSDLFGRRSMVIAGLAGFAIASAVGGAAVNLDMLIGARVAQGVFAAVLSPAILSTLSVTFTEPSERAKAFGIFGAITGGGAATGLLLGGALTEWASWRWALYINLVFAGVALVGASLLLARHAAHPKPVLDLPGTVTVTAALFSIVYGFSHAETNGWSNTVTIGFLIVGVALLCAFVIVETRVTDPLLPPRIVLDRIRSGAYLAVFTIGIGLWVVFLFLTYYMQLIRGYSPLLTGVAFLPMVAALVLSSLTTPSVLLPRLGTRLTVAGGLLVAAAGMAALTRIGLDTGYGHLLPGEILLGLGVGAAISVAMQSATAGVDHADAGVASAMTNASQQIGGSIGTALLSTFAATAMTHYLVGKAPSPVLESQAQIHSYITSFWWAAGFLAAGAIILAVLMRTGSQDQPHDGRVHHARRRLC